jgi:Uma2 family endonuclease
MGRKQKQEPSTVKEAPESYRDFERYEIIEGIRYDFLSSPTFTHQRIVNQINIALHQGCRSKGIVVPSPMDVHFDEDNVMQPDLVFILHERLHIVVDDEIHGAPDLLVEVLSPSTSKNDKIRKKAVYERFGVSEYWIIDPVHRYIDQFLLDDGAYKLHATYAEGDTVHSPLLPCAEVSIDWPSLKL